MLRIPHLHQTSGPTGTGFYTELNMTTNGFCVTIIFSISSKSSISFKLLHMENAVFLPLKFPLLYVWVTFIQRRTTPKRRSNVRLWGVYCTSGKRHSSFHKKKIQQNNKQWGKSKSASTDFTDTEQVHFCRLCLACITPLLLHHFVCISMFYHAHKQTNCKIKGSFHCSVFL